MKPWESQVTDYGTVIRPACAVCYQSWYEHKDHDHDGLESMHGRCPFRDCGEFREAKPVEERP